MEKKEKSRLSFRRVFLTAALGLFISILLMASFFGKKGLIEIFRAQKQQKALIQDLEHLEEKMDKLKREIEELKTNPKAVETKAREKLWLVKPDEVVIIKKNKEN